MKITTCLNHSRITSKMKSRQLLPALLLGTFLVLSAKGQVNSNPCSGMPDATFLPDWNNGCDAYVVCANGEANGLRCPTPYHFNPAKEICDFTQNVNCPPSRPVTIKCPETGFTNIPYPYSCTQFVECFNGLEIERSCAPGLQFNVATGSCAAPEIANCEIELSICPIVDDVNNIVFIPSSRSCSRYYLCSGRQTTVLQCAPTLEFNRKDLRCDLPERANCEIEVITPAPPPTLPPGDICSVIPGPLGNLPHPTDCRFYIRCLLGTPELLQCASGNLFDYISLRCELFTSARCAPGATAP